MLNRRSPLSLALARHCRPGAARLTSVLLGALLVALVSPGAPVAAQAAGAPSAATVAAGMHFSCAVHERRAYCWGHNDDGQLGDGGEAGRAAPAPVVGVSDVVEVGAGYGHGCARTANGDVYCWGDNGHAQVGGAGAEVRQARRVAGVEGATSLAVGGFHTCAVIARGAVRCWGSNSSNQSGGREDSGPTTIRGVRGATGVWAGEYHSCALTPRGAFCWGAGSSGQLGTGNYRNSPGARVVRGLPRDVTTLALGDEHSCALTSSGALCWGYEPFSTATDRSPEGARPQASPFFHDAVALFAGGKTTCGVDASGAVSCRGNNEHGEAGVAGGQPVDRPALIAGLSPTAALAIGAMHVCARGNDGNVFCWGNDSGHQTGRREPTWAEAPVAVPLPAGHTARSLSVEGAQSCVATPEGTIYCWGLDRAGVQIGHRTHVFGVRERPTVVDGVAGAMRVVTGGIDACALGGQGTVACWGGNLGRRANGDPGFRNPHTIPLPPARALAIAGGTACATDQGGRVRCVGINVDGVRGDGVGSYSLDPTVVNTGFSVASVHGGGYTMCALGTAGELACWGRGNYGQRGDGQSASGPTPTRVVGPPAWSSVSVGELHACGALPNGQVYCWGRGNEGQLGNGATGSYVTPVAVQGLNNATQVSVGFKHSCARTREGGVVCWGLGSHGQLGSGSRHTRQTPVAVVGLSNVASVHCGDTHTCARTETGQVFCWGDSYDGQLGTGISRFVREPVRVVF